MRRIDQEIKILCVRESEQEKKMGWQERITFERFCIGYGKYCNTRKLSYFLNDLVNSDRYHFKIFLQIFSRIVLPHPHTVREKVVYST